MSIFGAGHEVVTSTTRPTSPTNGQIIYETNTKKTMLWNNSNWVEIMTFGNSAAGGDLTGTYPSHTIQSISNASLMNSNTDISFRTSVIERMKIDSSGRITRPFHPVASVYKTSNTAAGNTVIWQGSLVNTGSIWDGSTRFNLPITGRYVVSVQGMSQNSSGYIFIDLYKNGVRLDFIRAYQYQNTGTGHKHFSFDVVINAAANDYLEFLINGNDMYADGAGYANAVVYPF